MEVDIEETEAKFLRKYQRNLNSDIKEYNLKSVRKNGYLLIDLPSESVLKEVENIIFDDFIDYFDYEKNGLNIKLSFKEVYKDEFIDMAVKQNIYTLKNRVNEIGVAEPIIQKEGRNRIVVQLPGMQDTDSAKEIIGTTATLEFRELAEINAVEDFEEINGINEGEIYKFKKGAVINGESIIDANSGFDPDNNTPLVSVVLDSEGGEKMFDFTSENQGKYMGSILEIIEYNNIANEQGKIEKVKTVKKTAINVARIQGAFSTRFQITGINNKENAHKLAILLRSGALAAPIEIIEEKTIGPNMGADNVEKGKTSILIGFIAVLIMMVFKYRGFGIIANICVFINLMMLLSALSFLGATLTLPGIAGILLTIGMSVDANVVIFERIKEEYNKTKKLKKSIENGYAKALSSIVDANITTLIAALILFSLGSGTIKGFAVTLSIGIVTSLITSVYLSKFFMTLVYKNKKTLKI